MIRFSAEAAARQYLTANGIVTGDQVKFREKDAPLLGLRVFACRVPVPEVSHWAIFWLSMTTVLSKWF